MGFYLDGLLFELHRDPAPPSFSLLSGAELYTTAYLQSLQHDFQVYHPTHRQRFLIWLVNYAKAGGAVRELAWLDLTLLLAELSRALPLETPPHIPLTELTQQLYEDATRWEMRCAYIVALGQWINSPLADFLPQLQQTIAHLLSTLPRPQLNDDSRDSLIIKLAQVHFCAPSRRAAYLRRALLSRWFF